MYDLVIIGAGWAGYNAALRAKALGAKAVLIEKDLIGGTCLNKGCIPTKTLIQSARVFNLIRKSKTFSVSLTSQPYISLSEIQARKEKIVLQLRQAMEASLGGMEVLRGQARFLSSETLEVDSKKIRSKFILIAVGSRPFALKGLDFDGRKIISSDELLAIQEIPATLLIIGGGVIGCEFASLFSTLGSRVTVAELMPQLLPGVDGEVAKRLENIFKKKGITVMTGVDATTLDINEYSLVLVSVGRRAELEGLELRKTGVRVEKNRIAADDFLNAGVPNIYAAGDCTATLMLAHFAGHQGRLAANNMFCPHAMQKSSDAAIPACIFTDPEIACVGLNEAEAEARGFSPKVGKFDFLGSGMARILDETEGFIKIISDSKNGQLIGASIIGPKATELIGILTVAVQSGLTVSGMKEAVFAHPTLSEGIKDALEKAA